MPYGSNAAFDTYATAAGYDVSSLTDADKTAALTAASLFVDGLGYKQTEHRIPVILWPGQPATTSQINEWPRTGASDIYGNEFSDSEIPTRIEHATYEAALHSLSGGDINRAVSEDQRIVREKVDVIETQYQEAREGSGPVDSRPVIPSIVALLSPILRGGENPYGITGVVA